MILAQVWVLTEALEDKRPGFTAHDLRVSLSEGGTWGLGAAGALPLSWSLSVRNDERFSARGAPVLE